MRKGQGTLDDPATVREADPGGMLALVADLGTQLGEGFALGRRAPDLPTAGDIGSVAVCGMGGSGIVGDFLRACFADRLPVPLMTVKGYGLPGFCGKDTLVIAISYSGETEETLAAYSQAVAVGCRVIALSSGGQLAALARSDGAPHVSIPGHVPAPRAALGFLVGAAVGALEAVGLLPDAGAELDGASDVLGPLSAELAPDRPVDGNRAKWLAEWLQGRTPVVWGSEGLAEAAALRWKTQLNENAKVPAFHAVLPELDHNEVEGWSDRTGRPFGLVVLRHPGEHPRIARRVEATMEAIAGSGLECREVAVQGSTPLGILCSFVMLADFTSTYLAILRGVDPMPAPVLTRLKERLR
ncbi:MAG TPA: bifunctional phosphoglucose/phosphomannose isomerase [Actinomycetota bacterium]|jgi:glucose/mannose-6-phosphate isomerase